MRRTIIKIVSMDVSTVLEKITPLSAREFHGRGAGFKSLSDPWFTSFNFWMSVTNVSDSSVHFISA